MFTLKLFRRDPDPANRILTELHAVHHLRTMQIGKNAIEIWAFNRAEPSDYLVFYVGEPEKGMDAYDRDDNHLQFGNGSWWGWGLLENEHGNTTQHFRPASYG